MNDFLCKRQNETTCFLGIDELCWESQRIYQSYIQKPIQLELTSWVWITTDGIKIWANLSLFSSTGICNSEQVTLSSGWYSKSLSSTTPLSFHPVLSEQVISPELRHCNFPLPAQDFSFVFCSHTSIVFTAVQFHRVDHVIVWIIGFKVV